MSSEEIREQYLSFFEKRGHVRIPSSLLTPEGDATTLFTGSGMQPLMQNLLGAPHPQGKRLVNSQKCFRAEDIIEVGDNRHTTFFEMLGNWSLGDYFKQEQLPWVFEFLTDIVGINPAKLYVTVFAGDEKYGIPRDDESVGIWKTLFKGKSIEAKDVLIGSPERGSAVGMQGGRIFYYNSKKNWWSRSGTPENMPAREPGGPDSEIFYEFTNIEHDPKFGTHCHPNCDCGRFMEIGNSVFMEYRKTEAGTFEKLPQKNVDFGGGLERITAAAQNNADMFAIDSFAPLIEALYGYFSKNHGQRGHETGENGIPLSIFRVFADHFRASMFLIADGVRPSNKDAGYMLRRLIRRMLAYKTKYDIKGDIFTSLLPIVIEKFGKAYPEIKNSEIIKVLQQEENKYEKAVASGLAELEKHQKLDAAAAFSISSTFGLNFELMQEMAPEATKDIAQADFDKEFKKHQELSRAGAEKKFGGHGLLLDTGELKAKDEVELKKVTRLHTATHLLQAALREVLGHEVKQAGSDITAERTRFDFTFGRKLTPEEIKKVEAVVNREIQNDLPVAFKEMPKDEAVKTGALYFFKAKYGDKVKVYYMGHRMEDAFSKEFCGGPHVDHTNMVGTFKIAKEEAVSAGVRRIRGVIEP